MIANAEQALDHLRHARTRKVLPTKNVARNTKLVYLHDDMVGLQFHNTIIAKYTPDGVVIDTRDNEHPRGWFTVTTWQRIDEFTPARTYTRHGLRHIVLDPSAGWGGEHALYTHGVKIAPDGSCERPMVEELDAAIQHTVRNFPKRARRWIDRSIDMWAEWGRQEDCCATTQMRELHCVEHILRSEPAITEPLNEAVKNARGSLLWGEHLTNRVREQMIEHIPGWMAIAIEKLDATFPYPQLPRRRR